MLSAYHKDELVYNTDTAIDNFILKEKNRFRVINIFSLNIPLSPEAFAAYEKRYEYNKALSVDGHFLPFGVTRKINTVKTKEKSGEVRLLKAIDEFTELEYKNMKNTKIISADYEIRRHNNSYNITAQYECIDFIGKKSNIFKEN